jgi:hypothetical protein
VTAPDDLAASVEKVRLSTQALGELIEPASAVSAELVDAIGAAKDRAQRRLAGSETTIALLGDAPAKRTLLNTIVGARAFDPLARACPGAVVTLRRARAFDYTAYMRDGSVLNFAARAPDRNGSFATERTKAEQARATAMATEKELAARLEQVEREGAHSALAGARTALNTKSLLLVVRAWRWLVRFVAHIFGRRSAREASSSQLSAADDGPGGMGSLRQALADARARVHKAAARLAIVLVEHPKYDQERGEAFLRDLRALTDCDARGLQVMSVSIQCPTSHLPADIALVDGGEAEEADGAVFVAHGSDAPSAERLADLVRALHPGRVHVVSKLSELKPALERARAERPIVSCARVAMAVHRCVARVSEETGYAAATCEKRIHALESRRIPDPEEFRALQLSRAETAIEKGAQDVEMGTLLYWREKIASTKRAWRLDIAACSDRKEVAGFVERLNHTASAELQTRVDDTVGHAIADLQCTSETVQTWLLEELHARYHVARSAQEGESPAAVVGEAIDMPALGRTPLKSTLDQFETRRVDLGLGGAAAGAVVGTLIVPGIGTAIGAFVGVFAGLLKGIDSLKQECVARLDECLDEVERHVAAQIAGRRTSFEEALRASLHDALDHAIERRRDSINRLMALERKVLELEHERRAKLVELRALVDRHPARTLLA